jgi:type IV pilus assembly protein PilA
LRADGELYLEIGKPFLVDVAMMNLKKQLGFTLIELMLVVALLGILASVALPNYARYRNRAAFSEALLVVSAWKSAIVVAVELGRVTAFNDIREGINGIPDKQFRDPATHGVSVINGEIKVSWRRDQSALDNVNYTLTPQNLTPPIQWIEGGTCKDKGFC